MKKTIKCGTWVSRKFIPPIAFVSGNKSCSRAVWRIEQVKTYARRQQKPNAKPKKLR